MTRKLLWQLFSTGFGTGMGFGVLWFAAGEHNIVLLALGIIAIIVGCWQGNRLVQRNARD